MHYNFYFDETFHDRKIVINENGTINTLLQNSDDSYIGVFIGFDNRNKSLFLKQFSQLESKYKTIFGITGEFKSISIKRNNFINGIKSFNKTTYAFYNDFFSILANEKLIFHINVLSKIELFIRKLYSIELLRKIIIPIPQFYYSLTKYIITYYNCDLIKRLYEAIEEKSSKIFTDELIKQINITIETIKDIERKEKEVLGLRDLVLALKSVDINSNIDNKIDFIYKQNFDGLSLLMKERGIKINKINLVIDKEQKTYESALEFEFKSVEEKHSNDQLFLRMVDHLCGFIGKMIYSLHNDKLFKEDKVIKIESLKDNDIIRKHLLSTEWFVITEKQFLLYKKIAKALAINQNYYWSSMSGAYCDEIVMFFSLLNYINQYQEYKNFMEVKSELHSEYYNGYVCSRLLDQYKKMY